MNNIYTDVIVYKDRVGKLIEKKHNGNTIYKFYPAGYGSYYEEELATIENPESEVTIANSEQGKEYAITEFKIHHNYKKYIHISDRYQIIVDALGQYYPYINYNSISRVFKSFKSALLGMIIYDSVGCEDIHLNKYIFKLLDMKE